MLGHQIYAVGLEVDQTKVYGIENLMPLRIVKGIRSFLGDAGFYRRFIKEFSKISRPLCRLLEKDAKFEFDEACSSTFEEIKSISCHTPDTRSYTNSDSNQVRGARLYTGTLIDLFFLRDELVPVVIQTIYVITKINYIYKRTTTGVVSLKIYTHILSPIYLYKPLYVYMSNINIRDCEKQCGEHLSLSCPTLLMWDVLSSILVLCFCTYTD